MVEKYLVFDFRFRKILTERETGISTYGNQTVVDSAIYDSFEPALTSTSPPLITKIVVPSD